MNEPPPTPGPGRPKGMPNKFTKALKDMVLEALELAGEKEGGAGYLKTQAINNPALFMTLIGKMMPRTIADDASSIFHIYVTSGVPRHGD